MKTLLTPTIAILAIALATPSLAQPENSIAATSSGYYEFRGTLIVTGFVNNTATNCSSLGQSIGSQYFARFTPPNLGSNGTVWRLSLLTPNVAWNYGFKSGNYPTSTAKKVDISGFVGRGSGTFGVAPYLSITTQLPSTLTTASEYVVLKGTIRNFSNDATTALSEGCDIAFRMTGALKP